MVQLKRDWIQAHDCASPSLGPCHWNWNFALEVLGMHKAHLNRLFDISKQQNWVIW